MGLLRFLSRRRPGKGVRLENGPDHIKPPKGHVACKVELLDGTDMVIYIPKKAVAQELYDQVFYSLDLIEKDYFGLQYTDIYQVKHWLDPTKKVKKQIKIGPPYTLRFRVKFYTLEPQNLREEYTRYQFYLQLKQDILTGRLECPFDVAVELSAYILQSDLGDYDPEVHTSEFISEYRFVPEEVQTEEMETAILEAYKKLKGQTPAQVELNFLRKVKWLEKYGQDLHMAYGRDGNEYQLGLNPHGILVVEGNIKIGHFFWHKTEKIHLDGKKLVFVVLEDDEHGRANEHTFPFRMLNKKAAKHLWKCAVEHHTFFRLNGPPKEAGVGNRLFRMNSRFRYSGKTEAQAAHETRPRKAAPQFERRPSQRYSRRSSVRRPPVAGNGSQNGPAESISPHNRANSSAAGSAEVLEFKTLSPGPVNSQPVSSPPTSHEPLSIQGTQTAVGGSSCEVLATSYIMMPSDGAPAPPPVPPRSNETRLTTSLPETSFREEVQQPPLPARTPIQPASVFSESVDHFTSPLSPTKPARILQNPPPPVQLLSDRNMPLELSQSRTSLKPIPEEKPNDLPKTPLTPAAPAGGFSYFVPPREVVGFKPKEQESGRPKEPAPKELVSILKKDTQSSNSYNATNQSTRSASLLRDTSNDSGRASPPSSLPPSRNSSALSAASKAESNRLSVEICDTLPLLHDEDVEHENDEPLPTMLLLPQDASNTKEPISEDRDDARNVAVCSTVKVEEKEPAVGTEACVAAFDRPESHTELELFDENDGQPLITASERSAANSISRSGSGASTGSNNTDKYQAAANAATTSILSQLRPWILNETKPYAAAPQAVMQTRRVITTEL